MSQPNSWPTALPFNARNALIKLLDEWVNDNDFTSIVNDYGYRATGNVGFLANLPGTTKASRVRELVDDAIQARRVPMLFDVIVDKKANLIDDLRAIVESINTSPSSSPSPVVLPTTPQPAQNTLPVVSTSPVQPVPQTVTVVSGSPLPTSAGITLPQQPQPNQSAQQLPRAGAPRYFWPIAIVGGIAAIGVGVLFSVGLVAATSNDTGKLGSDNTIIGIVVGVLLVFFGTWVAKDQNNYWPRFALIATFLWVVGYGIYQFLPR